MIAITTIVLVALAGKALTQETGQCGPLFGNTACDTNSASPCCSRYGWCGSQIDYCGVGCQEAFGSCSKTSVGTQLSYPGNGYRQAISPNDIAEILDTHNNFRASRGAQPLQWSDSLFTHMNGNWDNNGVFDHTQSGENLYAMGGADPSFKQAIESWYNEVSQYDWNNPGFTHETGHFTQVMWKGSQYVACQKNHIQGAQWEYIIVCQYDPAGNVIGQFAENV